MRYVVIIVLVCISFISGMYYQWADSEEKINLSHAVFLARSGLENISFHKSKHEKYLDLLGQKKYVQLVAELKKVNSVLTDQEVYLSATCENEACSQEQINYLKSGQINEP